MNINQGFNINSNFNNGRRRGGRGGRRGGRVVNREQQLYTVLNSSRIPKNLMRSSPFPPFMIRKMPFFEPSLIMQNALSSFVLREWRINDVYDPDPLTGGGTVAGFHELAAIYNLFRVENFQVRYSVSSNEPATALNFGIIFRDARPSLTLLTYADCQNALEVAPTSGPGIVGQTTGTSVFNSPDYKIKPAAVVGNPLAYMADTLFAGLGGSAPASPSQQVWMAFIMMSQAPLTLLPNGGIVHIYMEFTARWYSGQVVLE